MNRKAQHIQLLLAALILLIPVQWLLPNTWFWGEIGVQATTLLLSITILYFFRNKWLTPLNALRKKIGGFFGESAEVAAETEDIQFIGEVFDRIIESKQNATTFIERLTTGDLEVDAQLLAKNSDQLGGKLKLLRQGLMEVKDGERQRKWAADGLAKFVDILRQREENQAEFFEAVICNLVRSLDVNQGALYVVRENGGSGTETVLERKACYAYDRVKHQRAEVYAGEGLVGQAYLERDTIYMTEVPEDYIQIRSGLGTAEPRAVLIQPLVVNDEVLGIVELASFQEIQPYQQEFLSKLGENIAAAISSSRMVEKNQQMLQEYKQQSEEMQSQEEEMRQNMEELQATQEEMQRKALEVDNLLRDAVEKEEQLTQALEEMERLKKEDKKRSEETLQLLNDNKLMLTEILDHIPEKIFVKDAEGKFFLANTAVADAHNMTVPELVGTSDFDFFEKDVAQGYRDKEVEIVTSGDPVYFPAEVFKNPYGEDRILQTTKLPFYIPQLKQMGLLGIQFDITEIKNLEKNFEAQKESMQGEIALLKEKLAMLKQ